MLPYRVRVHDAPEREPQYDCVSYGIAAAQLFNGETDYSQPDAGDGGSVDAEQQDHRNRERKRSLRSMLFATAGDGHSTGAEGGMVGAKQLTQARQRAVHWEGSCLEALCKEAVDKRMIWGAVQEAG